MDNIKGWGVFEDDGFIHVYPVDEEHSQEIEFIGFIDLTPYSLCKCTPNIELSENKTGYIVIHGAFDGREALEETNEILKLR